MWLVEATNIDRTNVDKVMDVLNQKNIPYLPVGVIPFSLEITGLDSAPLEEGNVLSYGSTKLTRLIKELGFTPGVFYDPSTFNALAWHHAYKSRHNNGFGYMNDGGKFIQIRYLTGTLTKRRFVRPVMDLKLFPGSVVEEGDTWENFFSRIFKNDNYDKNILVSVNQTFDIREEYRFFIVNREVITASKYRAYGELDITPTIPTWLEKEVREIARTCWLPNDTCVMDIGLIEDFPEIIEFNVLNSSGLYAADVEKLVDALDGLLLH